MLTIQIILGIIAIIIIIAVTTQKKENDEQEEFEKKFSQYEKNKDNKEIVEKEYNNNEKKEKEYNQYYEKKKDIYDYFEKAYRTKTLSKKELGEQYEKQIGKYFEKMNFRIDYNGINNGIKDGGIDIIAWGFKKVLLIQCKNHKSQINQELLRKFIGDCKIYEENNKYKIKDKEIKRIFVSNSTADYGADRFLNENRNILEFLRIQAECRR